MGKGHAPLSLDSMRRRASQTNPESDKVIERPINDQSGSKREPSGQPNSDEGGRMHKVQNISADIIYFSFASLVFLYLNVSLSPPQRP